MKPALSLRVGQQVTMTPQLQQAIRLMQLSSVELAQEVREAIETNPMLDYPEETTSDQAEDAENAGEADDYEEREQADGVWEGDDPSDPEWTEGASEEVSFESPDIPEEFPVDTSWDDVYQASPMAPPLAGTVSAERDREFAGGGESLTDYLLWQLNLAPVSARDRIICTALVHAIDADGMLTADVGDVASDLAVEVDEVEAMLKLVQQFEPAGVGARDLRECLLLQLVELPADTPHREAARGLVKDCFDALAARDYGALARRSKLPDAALRAALELVRSLHPRPGSAVGDFAGEYVEPDVFVRRDGNRWIVELNPDALPRVRINGDYACLVRRGDNSPDNTFLRDNLREARWFLKSLRNRGDTLLAVAAKIVEVQRAFLEHGEEAMVPLGLAEIADAVGMHESTISRVTTRKYLHTPRGIFELKYFFSSHVGTLTGGEVSSTAIRALIRRLVADEDPGKPLSDSRIATLLSERNISVARRTIAKYRESMSMPPSSQRKRLL